MITNFLSWFDNFASKYFSFLKQTKAHYVLLFAFLGFIISFLIAYFLPINMYKIVKTQTYVQDIQDIGFAIAVLLAFLGIVRWQNEIVPQPRKWYKSLLDLPLYFICFFTIWLSVNAFSLGLNMNFCGLKNGISAEERLKLEAKNYFTPALIRISSVNESHSSDEDGHQYRTALFKAGVDLMKKFVKRSKTTIYADSQFVLKTPYIWNFEREIDSAYMPYYFKFSEEEEDALYKEALRISLITEKKVLFNKNRFIEDRSYRNAIGAKFLETNLDTIQAIQSFKTVQNKSLLNLAKIYKLFKF